MFKMDKNKIAANLPVIFMGIGAVLLAANMAVTSAMAQGSVRRGSGTDTPAPAKRPAAAPKPETVQSAPSLTAADTGPARPLNPPVDKRPMAEKFWLTADWYERGQIESVANYQTISRKITYRNPNDNTEVTALLVRPKKAGRYPGLLLSHGRRGFDPLVARRLAARGLVVLLPDLYGARFLANYPVEHLPATEADFDAGVDALLNQPDVAGDKICIGGLSRGGYYALKSAVSFGRQNKQVACYIGYYPHWQNPAAPEPDQVYRYASEVDKLTIPTLIFIGELEQYQRRRSIETGVLAMKAAGRDVRLIIYPAVGRGFDFKAPHLRTFADDLAAKDASRRAAAFIKRHLTPEQKQ